MPKLNGRVIAGLIIIGWGLITLLNNMGITAISLGYIFNLLWPLLLAAAGINFITRRDLAGMVTGGVMIAFGVVIFGRNTGVFDVDMTSFWQGFWPVIIILIGVNILFKSNKNIGGHLAIMGAVDKTKDSWDLKSTEYTAIMGGIDLDIRKAKFAEREITLELNAIMGGITVIVPDDVAVICRGTAILGGVDLLGKGSGGIVGHTEMQIGDLQNAEKIIHLNCTCIMGGIEIKK